MNMISIVAEWGNLAARWPHEDVVEERLSQKISKSDDKVVRTYLSLFQLLEKAKGLVRIQLLLPQSSNGGIEMKTIELYTEEDAKRDLEAGLQPKEASIKKWEYIRDAIDKMYWTANSPCGLCITYSQSGSRDTCGDCPFNSNEGCGNGKFREMLRHLSEIYHKIPEFIQMMKDLPDDLKSKKYEECKPHGDKKHYTILGYDTDKTMEVPSADHLDAVWGTIDDAKKVANKYLKAYILETKGWMK